MVATALIAILVLLFLAAVPVWRYSKTWGYYPIVSRNDPSDEQWE